MSDLFQQPMTQADAPETASPAETDGMTDPQRQVYQVACQRFQHNPDWVTFFREFLGVEGVVRKTFQQPEELDAFAHGETHSEIQHMVAKLRERSKRDKNQTEGAEPTRVITVRMPKSLHESLRAEAHDRHTSMNKLCISKLLQAIDNDLVPTD